MNDDIKTTFITLGLRTSIVYNIKRVTKRPVDSHT